MRSNSRPAVAKISGNFNADNGSNVSRHTVHRTLLNMGLRSCIPLRVRILTPIHCHQHGHSGVWTGSWTTVIMSLGSMNHVFCYTMWAVGYTCVVFLRKCEHKGALYYKNKLVAGLWRFGQCSSGKHCLLSFMWTALRRLPPAWTSLQPRYILSWQRDSPMAGPYSNRMIHHAPLHGLFGSGLPNTRKSSRYCPGLHICQTSI